MAKIDWSEYMAQYSNTTTAFETPASSHLPKGMVYDKTGNRLPTPYSLFSEWCSLYLTGDWAIMKTKGGLIVCAADSDDVRTLLGEFRALGLAKITAASDNTYAVAYNFSHYTALASRLGYVL